ncbi:presequence protease, mitochondrial [Leptopilina heterotoma]|uniref:presequence protease, mitochondrial n=1 Tax=Leptopilina heterotoma TaxID=63436 RepID=UPI001CA8CCF8|nr:presequence protease, mitochondrial [Leptopilina heterotoma]
MFSKLLMANKSWRRLQNITKIEKFYSSQPSPRIETKRKTTKILDSKYEVGNVIEGFKVTETSSVDEMFLHAIKLEHLRSGSQYLHLQRDDSNNVFSTGFRTTPLNSTGLPHILEHTVLCGSEKYPCRDPFFKMLRRSLATFINAMTAPDYTFYPFSTQNPKDYKNLMSVYLDSVFRPNLRYLDFLQEGYRLEHKDVNDKTSPIIFKGIVFNEMKGVFVENQNSFIVKFINLILPSHTYGVIAGGDPLEIVKLSHKDLVDFHSYHYHPSNARFYSYGNFPLEDHLKFLNNEYLSSVRAIDSNVTSVPSEKRWLEPRKEHMFGRHDPMISDSERQNSMAIGLLCSDINDLQLTFDLHVLSQLLLKGPNSAFYKSLVDSNIGTGFSPATGFDSQLKDTLFIVGLQGMRVEDFPRMEKAYEETIQKVMKEGFEKDHVAAVLHSIELHVKHQSSNFGMNLLFNIMPLWNHDGDIIQSLRINDALERFKLNFAENPRYLQELVEKYFFKNTHRLTLTMSPNEKHGEELANAENQLLAEQLEKLTENEKNDVFEKGQELLKYQGKTENVEVLPSLMIEDLKKDVERYNIQDLKMNGVPVQVSLQPTNEVCYYRAILNTKNLSPELKDVLPIFNQVVAKMGTENYDYRTFDQMIQLKTSGLGFANHVAEQPTSVTSYEEGVLIESYCLQQNSKAMWQFWEELFNRVKLTDQKRFETLVKMSATDLTNGIASAGHQYALSSAASLVSPVIKMKENLSGLEFITRMKKIAQLDDMSSILEQVQKIGNQILNKSCLRSALNISPENKEEIIENLDNFYKTLDGTPTLSQITNSPISSIEETGIHHLVPFSVNFASKAILTVPYTNQDSPILSVLAKLLTNNYLHSEVREKGGAYGGGARLSSDGIFAFYSYRDPNSIKTHDIFDGAYDFLRNYKITERDLLEAKLGLFQDIDSPIPPSNRGLIKFLYGITYNDIQMRRERIKSVTRDDIMRVGEKYLKPKANNVKVGRALIGPKNDDLGKRNDVKWIISNENEN